jgi:hypothetical protein
LWLVDEVESSSWVFCSQLKDQREVGAVGPWWKLGIEEPFSEAAIERLGKAVL